LVDAADEWKPTEHFGRRCLEDEELLTKGLVINSRGTWSWARDIKAGEQLRRGAERHL
jgi:hypothetical protein